MEEKNISPHTNKELLSAPKVLQDTAHKVENALKIQERKEAVFTRFPLLFTLLGAFGLVATFYGFEKVIDQTGLSENPWILLAIGLVVLIFTGTLYKKLGN
jgi:uncharacterized membrane protein